jgi:hypothetical protein
LIFKKAEREYRLPCTALNAYEEYSSQHGDNPQRHLNRSERNAIIDEPGKYYLGVIDS